MKTLFAIIVLSFISLMGCSDDLVTNNTQINKDKLLYSADSLVLHYDIQGNEINALVDIDSDTATYKVMFDNITTDGTYNSMELILATTFTTSQLEQYNSNQYSTLNNFTYTIELNDACDCLRFGVNLYGYNEAKYVKITNLKIYKMN